MSDFEDRLLRALDEMVADQNSTQPLPETQFLSVDVRAIRKKLGLSQTMFAQAYRIPTATLRNWEQGRRGIDSTSAAYLATIDQFPDQARIAASGIPTLASQVRQRA